METKFKGTKGIWSAECEKGIVRKYDGNRLCLLYYTNSENKSEVPYNALLISKAPEMLELLITIKLALDEGKAPEPTSYIHQIMDELIKEATKI